ncbi:carboxylating nicotinate-nucleotide diphosphorylase [Candidatus Saganbacteria bacterium]|nr:carboxylating nicotinate-nucleotide diphosphorylase [Candidatus Saganbacteria bacterium]
MGKQIENLIKMALAEDIGSGDVTSDAIIGKDRKTKAVIIAKEAGIIAGLPLAQMVFNVLDKKVKFVYKIKDGSKVKKGQIVAEISGPARSILIGERLALNFLQRLSGIATLTGEYVARVKGQRAKILDTRKTMPLWRGADKYAVLAGGGQNHRMGLYDAILIKDNHIKIVGGVSAAIKKAQGARVKGQGKIIIEIEAGNIAEVKEAISAGADRILLDNMNLKILKQAVVLCKKAKIATEASGGVNLQNVRSIAKTGVDFISVGALTHSPKALDISLKIV